MERKPIKQDELIRPGQFYKGGLKFQDINTNIDEQDGEEGSEEPENEKSESDIEIDKNHGIIISNLL